MDKDTFGDYAYCLSCYHKFKSYQRVLVNKEDKKSLKIMSTKEARIEMLKKKIESLELDVSSVKNKILQDRVKNKNNLERPDIS
jgi:hypothetical protein